MSLPAASARVRLPRLVDVAATRARLGVAPMRQAAPSRVPFVILVTFLLVGGAVTLLLFNTSLQQASFAEAALARQADTLAAQEQTLKLQLEDLRDPQRIALQAQRMGMVVAPAPQFLELPSGKLVGAAGVASRETGSLRLQARPPRKPAALQPEIILVPAQAQAQDEDQGQGRNR